MYMRFRMQIESVMKEVTFRAELRARALKSLAARAKREGWASPRPCVGQELRSGGHGVGGQRGGKGVVGGGVTDLWVSGFGSGRALVEPWPRPLSLQMWTLRPRIGGRRGGLGQGH